MLKHEKHHKIAFLIWENFSGSIRPYKALDSCKAHRYDDSAVVKPLTILFKNCISHGIFLDNWKKSNICPIHKKGDKQVVNNYRPVSLCQYVEKYLQD